MDLIFFFIAKFLKIFKVKQFPKQKEQIFSVIVLLYFNSGKHLINILVEALFVEVREFFGWCKSLLRLVFGKLVELH